MVTLKTILYIPILMCSLLAYGQSSDTLPVKFDVNNHGVIEFNYRNITDSMSLVTGIVTLLPTTYVESDPVKFIGTGKICLDLKIQMPLKVNLSLFFCFPKLVKKSSDTIYFNEDTSTTCFLVPDDTLRVTLDLAKNCPLQRCIFYSGKWAELSDYYKNKENYFKTSDFIRMKAIVANRAPDYHSFIQQEDSLTNIELTYLRQYDRENVLPKWFADYEENDIIYSSYVGKISQVAVMKRIRNSSEPLPQNYYAFVDEHPLNNPGAVLSVYYFTFLQMNFSMVQMPYTDSTLFDSTFPMKRLHGFINSAVQNFDENISDLLLAYQLEEGINNWHVPVNEYTLYINAIRNPDLKRFLDSSYVNKYVLKEGDAAPYFYLKDEHDKTVTLKTFEGNLVYITFWFVGCKACMQEIPEENRLVEKFKDKKVKIVSICMISSEESWKECIQKKGMKSITLFCKGNWGNLLKEKYDINAYPQHVIIDKHGKIIVNKVSPISEAEQLLRKYLDKD